MIKISFVILHYESLLDTEECLQSLMMYLKDENVNVVIVDNGSKKEKLSEIEKKYDLANIYYLYSDENLGFAKGNNIGFKFAKNNLHSDCIILCNNDLIFTQKDFVEKLRKKINIIDVAGPKIISLVDKKNQNPVPFLYPNVKSARIRLYKFYILYILSLLGMDNTLKNIFSKEIVEFTSYEKDDYQLHGACLIFGPNYIKRFEGLYDKTFMYMEESILKWSCIYNKMKMEYIPEIEVFHKEGSSTGKIYGQGKKKRQFYYHWNIDGCKQLIYMINQGGKKKI